MIAKKPPTFLCNDWVANCGRRFWTSAWLRRSSQAATSAVGAAPRVVEAQRQASAQARHETTSVTISATSAMKAREQMKCRLVGAVAGGERREA
jgi:hypothetical protein